MFKFAGIVVVGLVIAGNVSAQEEYAGFAGGMQNWPCTSNDHGECPLEASTGKMPQGEAYYGVREEYEEWLTLGGEVALVGKMMESHGRNYDVGGGSRDGRFIEGSGSVATKYDHYGVVGVTAVRGVAEVEVKDGVYVGPVVGVGAGGFWLDGDFAAAPVWKVGIRGRYELEGGWNLVASYSHMEAVGGSLAGRDLSWESDGFMVGLQLEF